VLTSKLTGTVLKIFRYNIENIDILSILFDILFNVLF